MPTKADLRTKLKDTQAKCDGAADILTDPALTDRAARVEAVQHLGFRPPAFLYEDGAWEDDADEPWQGDDEPDLPG